MPKEISLTPDLAFVPKGPRKVIVASEPLAVMEGKEAPTGKKEYSVVTYKTAVDREGNTVEVVDSATIISTEQLEWTLANYEKQIAHITSLKADVEEQLATIKGTP